MYSKRLRDIATLIPNTCKSGTDIGTDHAYLPIYLVKYMQFSYVLATDINKGPLDIAKKNIFKYKLDDKIELRLADGIKDLNDETDVLIIAGMGGMLIRDILTNGINALGNYEYLLLSPNKDSNVVRKTLVDLGYEIIDEMISFDYKYYPLILAKKALTKINYSEEELLFGPINIKKMDDNFIEMLEKERDKLSEKPALSIDMVLYLTKINKVLTKL